jgi:triacylglycerol lipase
VDEDVVVLVPGLLGFREVSDFTYFHRDVLALLQAGLRARLGRAVRVEALGALATAPLAERQARLLSDLAGLGAERLHLIGHSTGGLDAALLTRARPLAPHASWAALDPGGVRGALCTVVAVAAPFHGTWLADTDVAAVLDGFEWSDLRFYPRAARALAKLVPALWGDEDRGTFAQAALRDRAAALAWFRQARPGWRLIRDLSPARMQAILPGSPDQPSALVRSVATVTTLGPETAGADGFFRLLYAYAAGRAGFITPPAPEPRLDAAVTRLGAAPRVIRNPSVPMPPLDQAANDGVVNTCRQLLDAARPDELLALVVGDHMDVLGHYDRRGRPQGVLHSGAGFGAAELGAVWGTIVDAVAPRCRP